MACSNVTLAGLKRDCETSKGGIKEVYIAKYTEALAASIKAAIPTASASTEVPSASTSDTFYVYEFRRNTGSMTSTLNVDDANGVNYVSTDVVLQFNKMDSKKRTEIAALSLEEMIILVVDSNNRKWFIGLDAPVCASAGTAQTGTAVGDGNYYQITLQANDDEYPYSWAGALPTPGNNA
jgi:hypothetical protein